MHSLHKQFDEIFSNIAEKQRIKKDKEVKDGKKAFFKANDALHKKGNSR